uniref:G patch domain-containing protein 1 n=1 Tax=Kwoniella dejecticola CBS 10117 TaxID=1296121 RepID=A0A1A5ZXS4_9TREE|nr:G patch domain-containing protein 1 [Kwoniella dejecticola CBS 10117]OBR82611.1 G patch domain-containing protein 1 [Kwoniella dejecticola CBS 10117]
MTSRLKHKLELENVNLNSAYLNESFVQIGTPLPALSERKKDKQEYVPEWQQEVRDEQGRRRFHGAFTGGFSAGYYNTVGSKEGWTPSTFKSSRSNRANKVQRAEDFMDEEDLQHMKDDRQLENTSTFKNDGFGGTKEELGGKSLPSAIESLIAPSSSSIGEKLLQKLGWRPGQGIGPRVTLRKLKLQQGKLGKARAGIEEDDEEDGEGEGSKHTYAPRDVQLLSFAPKEDKQGLGFIKGRGMGSLPGKRPMMGARHPDDDHEDPYSEAGPSTRHLAFDGMDDDDEVILMGGPRPGLGSKSNQENRYTGTQDTWHDGRPVLPRFSLDPKGVPPDKWFVLPDIPPDWRPRPARVWGTTKRWDQKPGEEAAKKEVIRGESGKPLTFEQRGAALGEEQRISTAKSVFEYMSTKDRERLASLAAAAPPPPPGALSFAPPIEEQEIPITAATEVDIPPLSPRTASAALKGFIPYADDLERQNRYISYLKSQTYNTETPNPVFKKGTIDEINKELSDFSTSARIFKPMSYAMSNRFTSGSSSLAVSDAKQAKPGLHIFDVEKAKADQEAADALKKKQSAEISEVQRILTPREEAAKSGMYGKMTRETRNWYPVKLICRRWGVKDPHPEGDPNQGKDSNSRNSATGAMDAMPLPTNDASWESRFIHKPNASTSPGHDNANSGGAGASLSEGGEKQPTSITEVGMANDINQGRDTLTYSKPSIDIFKAIFASDDEDDDEDEAEDKVKGEAQAGMVAVASKENSKTYEDPFPVPVSAPVLAKQEGPVDLNTFKPVFSIRKDDAGDGDGAKKKKKDKSKSKKRKGVLSFDVGDDDGDEEAVKEDRKKKKKDQSKPNGAKTTHEEGGEGEGEWVEKPNVVPRLVGRKGAADFM